MWIWVKPKRIFMKNSCKITVYGIVKIYQKERADMNKENKEIADILREEVKKLQSDRLIKLESERKLEQRLQVGRQRVREVIGCLSNLLLKPRIQGGRSTYPYSES